MSLIETLATVVIFSIVLTATTAGATTASRVYSQVKEKSNAQTLMSTTFSALSADLYNASEVDVDKDTKVNYFYNQAINYNETYQNDGTKGIQRVYIDRNEMSDEDDSLPLVAEKSRPDGQYAAIDNFTFNDGVFRFDVVIYSADQEKLDEQTFAVRSSLILQEKTGDADA